MHPNLVQSGDASDRASVVIERLDTTKVVQRDGSLVATVERMQRANSVLGAAEISPLYLGYETGLATLAVLAAYTVDSQGKRHDVPPTAMRDISADTTGSAPIFNNVRQRVVLFPYLTTGGRQVIRYRVDLQPQLPGTFSDAMSAPVWPVMESRIVYDLPSDMRLYADARGYEAVPPVEHDGRTRYGFTYRRDSARQRLADTVQAPNVGDYLIVSTFPDYAAFAAAYRALLGAPPAPDPAVVALARTLTAHDADDHARAATLYDWVRSHIRYVAIHLGRSDLVPRAPVDVLRDGYGDCKDVVGLYGALLDAVGIRHDAVLLRAEGAAQLPRVPALAFFDHVIAYLPDSGTYADLTGSAVGFGYLPPQLLGAAGVRVGDGAVVHLPARQESMTRSRFEIDLQPGGDAKFALRLEWDGYASEFQRSAIRNVPAASRPSLANAWFAENGIQAVATFDTSDVALMRGAFQAAMHGALPGLVLPAGNTEIRPDAVVQASLAPTMASLTIRAVRTEPFRCLSDALRSSVRIVLPEGATLAYLPDDVSVHVPHLDYASRYRYDAARRMVEIARDVSLHFDGSICSPAQARALAQPANVVRHDLEAHVVVRMPPRAPPPVAEPVAEPVAGAGAEPVAEAVDARTRSAAEPRRRQGGTTDARMTGVQATAEEER
ncbi:DUF3857 domain-containing transglutaminase family protein [Chitinasiproducens palmae]|uniref:DUF3857 domain-containing transglutaminase family protein n=1 Tax=Chitinasiproducens palmae TaxID=1770053 RepID=UPI0011139C5B|nr:DUF3857 and transglutaminase domain-containing protein [Chitinasiproducens palmae]